MSPTTEWINTIGSIASIATAVGVLLAFQQLRVSKRIAQLQFEDGLAKEYRDLIACIPARALLGHELSEKDYQASFDELFRYIDLSNEQVYLRQSRRISAETWNNWVSGIKTNLSLPTFKRAWTEIKSEYSSFQELRHLEAEAFKNDPARWKKRN